MNIIEKLEGLQRYEQGRHGEMQKAETYHSAKYISDHDLRAIIEEYKKQEPVAWLAYQGTFQMIADTKDKLPKQSQYSAIPLFTHPPLSDETVKDAERYRWLREQNWDLSELSVVVNPKVAVKLGHDCPSLNRLDIAIDEAMKAES